MRSKSQTFVFHFLEFPLIIIAAAADTEPKSDSHQIIINKTHKQKKKNVYTATENLPYSERRSRTLTKCSFSRLILWSV